MVISQGLPSILIRDTRKSQFPALNLTSCWTSYKYVFITRYTTSTPASSMSSSSVVHGSLWHSALGAGSNILTVQTKAKLPSVPTTSIDLNWQHISTCLRTLSLASINMLIGNLGELTQGKPQEFMDHLISTCSCSVDTAVYLCATLLSASWNKSWVHCYHIH